jgi:hypothetical protein
VETATGGGGHGTTTTTSATGATAGDQHCDIDAMTGAAVCKPGSTGCPG